MKKSSTRPWDPVSAGKLSSSGVSTWRDTHGILIFPFLYFFQLPYWHHQLRNFVSQFNK